MLLSFPPLVSLFLAWRNLRLHKGRTLLTLAGITLGVAVVLAIQVTNESTLESIRRLFERSAGQASLVVTSINPGVERMDAEITARLEKAPGIQIAAPSVRVQTLLANEARSWQIAFTMTGIAEGNLLILYGIEPDLEPQVRYYRFAAGRMVRPGEYEVVLPQKYAEEKGLHLGGDLSLLLPEGTARLKIVGLLAEEGVALLNDGAVAFAAIDVVQDLFEIGAQVDEVALRLQPALSENPKALEEIKRDLNQRLKGEAEVVYPGSRGQLVSQMLATYQLGLSFFSLIAVFVGAFLVYNTFSMSVVERNRQIGMLRAIGVKRWGVMRMVLAEALLLSLVGCTLGLGLGMLLARGLMSLVGQATLTIESLRHVPWQGLWQSLAVGVGMTLASALLPAFQAARISPLEALRARTRGIERARALVWISGLLLLFVSWMTLYRIPWRETVLFPVGSTAIILVLFGATLTVTLASNGLERLSRPLARVIYGNEGALGSANVRRSVSRTTLTVASLMVALTMIISIHSMAFSFEQDMSAWIVNALGGDLYVRSPLPMRLSFARQLQAFPGVQVVTPVRILSVRMAPRSLPADQSLSDTLYYTAIEPRTYRQIADMEFVSGSGDADNSWARLEEGNALFISSVMAERYNLNVGDRLYLLTRRGEQPFEVAAVVIDFTGQGQVVYGTYADLQRWFGENGVDRFTLKVAPAVSAEAVAQAIKERYQSRRPISLQTTEAFRQSIMNLLDQVFRLFDVLSLIGVIIGALGVINTLAMNVLERQQEIGGLRSLGMTRRQIARMVLAEALALGVMGGVYGLGFGHFVGRVMVMGMNMMVGYNLVYRFTPRPFVIGAFIALVVVQLAAYLPARRAARVNIVEAIKHE